MMKSSTLFECGHPPLHPPDIIQVVGVAIPSSIYYTEQNPKNKKWGRPGNKAMFTVKCLVLQIPYYLVDFCGIDTG